MPPRGRPACPNLPNRLVHRKRGQVCFSFRARQVRPRTAQHRHPDQRQRRTGQHIAGEVHLQVNAGSRHQGHECRGQHPVRAALGRATLQQAGHGKGAGLHGVGTRKAGIDRHGDQRLEQTRPCPGHEQLQRVNHDAGPQQGNRHEARPPTPPGGKAMRLPHRHDDRDGQQHIERPQPGQDHHGLIDPR